MLNVSMLNVIKLSVVMLIEDDARIQSVTLVPRFCIIMLNSYPSKSS
jgi:hypothetical protein